MTDELTTTLDYIDNIIVEGNPFAEPANEYYALLCLHAGLAFLYRQAEKCDQIALKKIDPKKQIFIFGNSGLLPEPSVRLLACAFQWYSVSACQYVGTVGTIAYLQDNNRLGVKILFRYKDLLCPRQVVGNQVIPKLCNRGVLLKSINDYGNDTGLTR